MGTPHRGSTYAVWAKTVSNIVNTLTLSSSIRGDLLQDLKTKSKTLQTISSQFVQRTTKLQIVSFYERQGLGTSTNLVRNRTLDGMSNSANLYL